MEEKEIKPKQAEKENELLAVSADIKIGIKDMFYYCMYHNYACFSGLFGLFISFGALILLVVRFQQYAMPAKCVLILAALLFTVIQPLQLLLKAAVQVKNTPMFHEPIRYTFRETGLELSQGEQSGVIDWKQIMKVVDTGGYLIIYITKLRAYIFPKKQLGDVEKVKDIITRGCSHDKDI